ncbi:MAG: DUF3035 domain-containing protein [Dongiaceae bacterium]
MRSLGWMGVVAVLGLSVALGGCGNQVRQALGMTKRSPDEFQVVAHAPLTLPPDYNLRPPEPGAPRPQEGTTRDQAQTALYNNGSDFSTDPSTGGSFSTDIGASGGTAQSTGEAALLQNAGATGLDSDIRAQIDAETAAQVERDQTLIERLVFWRNPEPMGTVVDPVAETERLRENQALGKPVTEGETPIIIRRRQGLLEGIF